MTSFCSKDCGSEQIAWHQKQHNFKYTWTKNLLHSSRKSTNTQFNCNFISQRKLPRHLQHRGIFYAVNHKQQSSLFQFQFK